MVGEQKRFRPSCMVAAVSYLVLAIQFQCSDAAAPPQVQLQRPFIPSSGPFMSGYRKLGSASLRSFGGMSHPVLTRGDLLVTSSGEQVICWSLKSGMPIARFPSAPRADCMLTSFCLSANDDKIILATFEKEGSWLWIIDIASHKIDQRFHVDGRGITAIVSAPNNHYFATGSEGGLIRIWESGKTTPRYRFTMRRTTRSIAWLERGTRLRCRDVGHLVRVFDLASTSQISERRVTLGAAKWYVQRARPGLS